MVEEVRCELFSHSIRVVMSLYCLERELFLDSHTKASNLAKARQVVVMNLVDRPAW